MALVDVLIPAFNAAKTIAEAVGSIQAQTVRDIRIIVIDDGSSDDTAKVVGGLAENDARIHLLSKKNSGIVDALNYGLSICDAEFIARHDADDNAFPERFEEQLKYLSASQDCVAVSSNCHWIDQHGERMGKTTTFGSLDEANPEWFPAREMYLMHPMLMVRHNALQQIGGYRHAFHAEDVDLYWRLSHLGRLHNLPDMHGEYRMHPDSVTSRSILNGRVTAVNSQLATLSELRRRSGRPDVAFPSDRLSRFHQAQTLEGMIDVASDGLDQHEKARLSLASATKLIELTGYRPYELELSDCSFIRKAVAAHGHIMTPQNRLDVRSRTLRAGRRLLSAGQLQSVIALVPPALYPRLVAGQVKAALGRA